MRGDQGGQIHVDQGVAVQHDERPSLEPGARPLDPASRAQEPRTLLRVVDPEAEGGPVAHARPDLIVQMVQIERDLADPGVAQEEERVVQEDAVQERQKGLRALFREREQAGAQSRRQHHRAVDAHATRSAMAPRASSRIARAAPSAGSRDAASRM